MEEEEKFKILESKMNYNFSLEEERGFQLNNQLSGPYSIQIRAIIEKLRLIDENSDKEENSDMFHKLSKLFKLPLERHLPRYCKKIGKRYSFVRKINGRRFTIKGSHSLEEAIKNHHEFCKENNLNNDYE